MKKKIAIGLGTSIVVIALIMTMGLSSLFAETQSEQDNDQSFISRCGEAVQKGFGVISEAIQKLLGMGREEIQEERQEESSLLEIAESKDVTAGEIEALSIMIAEVRDEIFYDIRLLIVRIL